MPLGTTCAKNLTPVVPKGKGTFFLHQTTVTPKPSNNFVNLLKC